MKIIRKILPLGIALGLSAGSFVAIAANQKKAVKVAKADPVTEIPMAAESFLYGEGYEAYANPTVAGTFAAKDVRFWDNTYTFNALDTFFRGEVNEGWTGKLRTISWTQYTQYVYFQWGGAKDYDVTGNVTLKFHYSTYETEVWNNTFSENPMMLNFFKIPDTEYNLLTENNDAGFEMWIELIDERTADNGGYSFHNFGYLHVNQTVQQVGEAIRYYINHMDYDDGREWKVNNNKAIFNHYLANAKLFPVYRDYALGTVTMSNVNEDFENQSTFLDKWMFDPSYFGVTGGVEAIHMDRMLSSGSVRPGDSQMPFNKTDNKFFRGWYEDETEGGFVHGDAQVYRFLSRPFVLTGSGIVSIKMGGTASLFVIDASNLASPVVLQEIRNQYYSTGGTDQRLDTGFNTCTMVRHVINLSAYKNQTIQLAIADYSNGGWAAAYFDELELDHDISDGFRIDLINQAWLNGPTYYTAWLDKYVSLGVDNYISQAYSFVESYLALARNGKAYGNMCSVITSDEMITLIGTTFENLSADAKVVVCASDDYDRGKTATESTWATTETVLGNLGKSIVYIANWNHLSISAPSLSINSVNNSSIKGATFAIVISAAAVIALFSFGLVIFIKKKKEN